jgi:hypothetical protein
MFLISFFSAQTIVLLFLAQAADSPANSFKELGYLFLWGMLGAVVLALVVAIIWIKIQDGRGVRFDNVSIDPSKHDNQV